MFKLLRSRAKFFYWIIAVTFVLFTFVVWGAQCNQNPRSARQAPRILGSINGLEISYDEWEQELKSFMARLRQQYQDRAISANQRTQAEDNVWQQLLRSKLAQAEIEKRDLYLSDEEVLDILKNDPPRALLAQYTNEEGVTDYDAYYADLANPERDWTNVEAYIRGTVPFQRLNEALAADVVVTDKEVRDEYYNQTGRALAEYIGVEINSLVIDGDPDDAAISDYYSAHIEDYDEPEQAIVETVVFPKLASDMDEEDIRLLAEDVRREILSGEIDFIEAAAIYSEDSTRESGGDLGTFDRDRMVPAFTEAAFSLEPGELSEPVRTQFGYHLIEVLEQIETDGEVSEIHARHILFKITPSEDTLAEIYDRADLFRIDAEKIGFREAASDAALEVSEPSAVRKGWDLPSLRDSMKGTNFAFLADVGLVSRVFENDDNFYVVHVLEKLPEGPAPLEDVRSRVVTALNRERKLEMANEKLNPAIGALQMGGDMAPLAEEYGLTYAVTDTFSVSGNISGIGYNTDFNKAVIDNEVGDLVDHVETTRGVYALRILWKSDFDEAAFAAEREALYARLLQSRQYEVLNQWFDDKIAEADIVDNRDVLYRGF